MTIDLVPGAIGVSANQRETIELAARYGFESVGADGSYLAELSEAQGEELRQLMAERKIVFGAAGLPVEFRRDDPTFKDSLAKLPKIAGGLHRAGVQRTTTWLSPASDSLPYLHNFRQHATRLREVAKVLQEQGCRLGLEYVGPRTSWSTRRYPFIHTLAELKELIAEIGMENVGVVLDSWHWYCAGDTVEDLLGLRSSDVVAVDLNDAPASVAKEAQIDNRRELPAATGVIDVKSFLQALNRIEYDGPVRAEPFNAALNQVNNDEACAAVATAMKKALVLAGL